MNSIDHGSLRSDVRVARRTFLCADVDSFSPLTERLGDRASLAVIRRVEALIRTASERYGGELLEVRGDGFLLAFENVRAAAAAGFAIARGLEVGEEPTTLTMRMAIHTGDVLVDRGRYFGRTLIAAFRLVDRAGPSDLLLSAESARELLGVGSTNKPEWERFEPKGLRGELQFLRMDRSEIGVALH